MDIFNERAKCSDALHELLMEEVDKECASHDKTYAAPFKKKLERIIENFIETANMSQLFGRETLSINVKVIRSAKVEGSYTVFVNVGDGIFYEKIVHDGVSHKTTTEKLERNTVEVNAIPLPIPIPTEK